MFTLPIRSSMQISSVLPTPKSSKLFVLAQLPQHALSLMIQSLWQNIFRIQGLCHTLLVFCNNNNLFTFNENSSCCQILPSSAKEQTSFFVASIEQTSESKPTLITWIIFLLLMKAKTQVRFCRIMKIAPAAIFLRNCYFRNNYITILFSILRLMTFGRLQKSVSLLTSVKS